MGVLESLKESYFSVEDKYYDAMDYLEHNVGVPVYDYFINPVEGKGIPSMPLAILLFLLAIGGAAFAAMSLFPPTATLTVNVLQAGSPIEGVPVTVYLDGKEFKTVQSNADGVALFEKVPVGRTATIRISKESFEPFEKTLTIGRQPSSITASLEFSTKEPEIFKATIRVLSSDGPALGGVSVSYTDSA
ncbi:MAG: carboxypeptidase-like regulatory domain-containing protein, partial [Candidatus Micrarchaeota archaeon]